MKIQCPNCNKVYDIPDERLPRGKEVALPCPACKTLIELDLKTEPDREDFQKKASHKNELPKGEELKKRILKSVDNLPPMPQILHKAQKIMENPSSSFKDLASVLETDQAIAARVLKLANSTYYGLSEKVASIQRASVVLGHKTLGEIITVASSSDILGNTMEGYELDSGDLWIHSMAVAFGSRLIAERKYPQMANDVFSAGLIHDSGKLILDPYIRERKDAFREFMEDRRQSFLEAEKDILGFDHSEIAAEVCRNWNIPEALITAIKYHHEPSRSQGHEMTYIVHMADSIALMSGIGAGVDGMLYHMDERAMEFLGISQEDLSEIMIQMAEYVQRVESEAAVA